MTLRLGCDDFHEDGVQFEDSICAVPEPRKHGLDLADLSIGINTDDMREPLFSRAAFMAERGARVKREVAIPVGVSWNPAQPVVPDRLIREGDDLGLIDLVFLGPSVLANPHWPIWAARELAHEDPFPILPQDCLVAARPAGFGELPRLAGAVRLTTRSTAAPNTGAGGVTSRRMLLGRTANGLARCDEHASTRTARR